MDDFDAEKAGDDRREETEMRWTRPLLIAGLWLAAPGAQAQLLPAPAAGTLGGGALGGVGQVLPDTLDRLGGIVDQSGLDKLSPARLTDRLAAARAARIDALLRQHGATSRAGGKAKVVADLKAAHGYKTVVMIGDGATDMEARDIEGGADAFIGFGGIAVREKVRDGADWFVTDFAAMIAALE